MAGIGKILVLVGILVVLIGLVIWLGGDKLSWLGRLPGDIRIEKENLRLYFPITTMVLLSIFLSLVVWLIRRFF